METRRTAVVTGATSGIGSAFAERFARDGFDLLLTGRRAAVLRTTASGLARRFGVTVTPLVAELSDGKDLAALVRRVRGLPRLDALVSNAGFGIGLPFSEAPLGDQLRMIDVHLGAAVRLVHAALGRMRQQGSGTIILVASMAAFLPLPKSAVYCGTKAFLHAFAEAIAMENRDSGLRVQSLCPGLVDTDFHRRNVRRQEPRSRGLVRWTTPGRVVETSMRDLARGRLLCIPGFWNRVGYVLVRLMPRGVYARLGAGPGVSADSIRGRGVVMDERSLHAYARVLLRAGVNLQPGQNLLLRCNPAQRECMLAVAEEAYRAGADRAVRHPRCPPHAHPGRSSRSPLAGLRARPRAPRAAELPGRGLGAALP